MLAQARPLWAALPDGALKRQLIGELAEGVALDSQDLLQLWQQPAGRGRSAETPRSRSPDGESRPGGQRSAYGTHAGATRRSNRSGGTRRGVASRADRAMGLLMVNARAWDSLSADDHAMLSQLSEAHAGAFAWLESQLNEHGPQAWAALREALRGHENETFICTQVDAVLLGAADTDSDAELSELAGVINQLRIDNLQRQSQALSEQGAHDPAALRRLQDINGRIKALKAGQPV